MRFFSNLLKAEILLDETILEDFIDVIPRLVDDACNKYLIVIPSLQEIKDVILSFERNKAPSPNGFPMFFFQMFWEIVGNDVGNTVKDFFWL